MSHSAYVNKWHNHHTNTLSCNKYWYYQRISSRNLEYKAATGDCFLISAPIITKARPQAEIYVSFPLSTSLAPVFPIWAEDEAVTPYDI